MKETIAQKLSGACRWFDLLDVESSSSSVSFKNNALYAVRERQSRGFGLRVNRDGRTGFSHTTIADDPSTLIENALRMAPYGDAEGFDLSGDAAVSALEPYREEITAFDCAREIEKGNAVIRAITERFPDVSVELGISAAHGVRRLFNSEGFDRQYRFSSYTASLVAERVDAAGVKVNIWEGINGLSAIDIAPIAERLCRLLSDAQTLASTESGRLPVVLTPKAVRSLLGILEAGLSARQVHKGISPFAQKIGERVFNPALTMHDRPCVEGSPFSFPFDDEGVESRDKAVIDAGSIACFISDRKYAHVLGIPNTGNASRGYASLPSPSFSMVAITPGDSSFRNMIGGVNRGILVDQFIGLGQSNTITGDFSANLDLAYLIDNGELCGRVKDCMISDNLFTLLAGELQLSSETEQVGSSLVPYVYFPAVNYTR